MQHNREFFPYNSDARSRLSWLIGFSILFLMIVGTGGGCKNDLPPIVPEQRGPSWMVITTDTNKALASNSINAIVTDPRGETWIATDNGVTRCFNGFSKWQKIYNPLVFQVYQSKSCKINAITIDKGDFVWYGLAGGGVRRSDRSANPNSFESMTTPRLTSDMVHSLATDYEGDIWIGTASGVTRFIPNKTTTNTTTNGNWVKYTSTTSLIPDEPIRSVVVSPVDWHIWFGTYSHGIVSYDGDMDWNFSAPSETPFPILAMAFSYPRTAWFGTYGDWAYKYSVQTTEWTQLVGRIRDSTTTVDTTSNSDLPGYIVNAIAVDDPKGAVWFGTDQGLARMHSTTWTVWDETNSPLPSKTIRALAMDRYSNLWIGTANGLAIFNEEGIRQ
jgi:ligand-binding sensor domain-containing protein